MKSKKQLLKSWKVYAILDDEIFSDRDILLSKFHDLMKSPVDAVQLRFKNLTDPSFYRIAKEMVSVAKRHDIPLIINDRPDCTFLLGASGVHLGKSDISATVARKILGRKAIIGKTIRSVKDLYSDGARDADYVAIGPVFKTPLKPGLKPVTRSTLHRLCEDPFRPLVAIGGINKKNVKELCSAGVETVAFVRYGMTDRDTAGKIRAIRAEMCEQLTPHQSA